MIGIDRERVKKVFAEYVENYDASQEKIKLKINHTYRVAALCDRIAKSLGLGDDDVEFAWLSGMMHDVGRFEQVRRFNTFDDSKSVSHAMLSAEILFDDKKIYDYVEKPDSFSKMLRDVIEAHSLYRIPEDFDERTKMFANILRDADKVDILKVNVESPIEEIYNVSTEELMNSAISKEVIESFHEEHCINRIYTKTPADHIVGHISLVFELVYDESLKCALEQGYLDKLMNFKLDNKESMEELKECREHMYRYIEGKIKGDL